MLQELKSYILWDSSCFTLKCADCICDVEDCKVSQSSFECPNCILEKCCCWKNFHLSANNNNSLNLLNY